MNTDSHFRIGAAHFVCEDYALHGPDYVVVSDGCSHGSDKNEFKTDIGARILAQNAALYMEHLTPHCPDRFMYSVLTASDNVAMALGLGVNSLAATLMVLKKHDDAIISFLMGDGLIGGKRRDGSWIFSVIDFESNAPFYLAYLGEKSIVDQYQKNQSDKITETSFSIDPQGNVEVQEYPHHVGPQGWRSVMRFPIEEYEMVFVASDGVETFKGEKRMLMRDLVPFLFGFKSYNGQFIRRTLNWQFKVNLEGSLKHRGLMHDDDLAMGAIYCGED